MRFWMFFGSLIRDMSNVIHHPLPCRRAKPPTDKDASNAKQKTNEHMENANRADLCANLNVVDVSYPEMVAASQEWSYLVYDFRGFQRGGSQ